MSRRVRSRVKIRAARWTTADDLRDRADPIVALNQEPPLRPDHLPLVDFGHALDRHRVSRDEIQLGLPAGWESRERDQVHSGVPQSRTTVSSSSSYGLVAHLRLLPSSPYGDAVSVGRRAFAWRGLAPLGSCTLTGALARALQARDQFRDARSSSSSRAALPATECSVGVHPSARARGLRTI